MTGLGKRTRPTRSQRLNMMLKRATTAAGNKHGIGGVEKRDGNKPRPITLAPVGRPEKV